MEIVWTMVLMLCFSDLAYGVFDVQSMDNFSSARVKCNLATPRINFTANGPFFYLDSINGLDEGETAWIGYIQDYEIFQFLGCVETGKIQRTIQMSITIEKDIGQCQYFCRSYQYFGVQTLVVEGVDCRCINVTNPDLATRWLSPCKTHESDNEFLFGDNSTLSIYKIVTTEVENKLNQSEGWTSASLNCAEIYEPNSNTYQWKHCSESLKVLCKSKNDSTIWEPPRENYFPWRKASERCLRNNMILIPYQYRKLFNETNRPQYWTSNIRAYVMSTVKERPFTGSTQYGYVKRSGDRYLLYFEPKLPNTSRKALCDDILTSISQSVKISTTPYTATSETIDPMRVSSTESLSTITGGSKADNENVAVLVAVPLIIVVLIVCGVIGGIFIWRRIKAKQTKANDDRYNGNITNSCEDNEINNDHRPEISDVYNEIGDKYESPHEDYEIINALWIFEPERNSVNNSGYSVLEKVQNKQFKAVKNDDYDSAREPETNETTPRNFIHHGSKKVLNKKTNLSEIDKKIIQGYDYSMVMPKNRDKNDGIGNDFDYDHLDQDNKKPKGQHQLDSDEGNVYNKTNENKPVDTYDHIKDEIHGKRISLTGNSMGFNALSKTYNKWKDVPLDSNDTYNHVNQVLNSTLDEQPYNTTYKQVDHVNPYDHARAT